MNDLSKYSEIFSEITPWSGQIPPGFTVDFIGVFTSKDFLIDGYHPAFVDGAEIAMQRPRLGNQQNGEFWFEAADWMFAVKEARERFVMITLGALYGYQAVGCSRLLQLLNPMPYKLVAIEPIPENVEWVKRHMRDNGIDPDEQWVVQAAISDRKEPALFPVGSPGLGAQNCIATNEEAARIRYFEDLVNSNRVNEALQHLLLDNSTGLQQDIIAGRGALGEIKLVSTVTLEEVLGPFKRVDFLEADIQQSEIIVFPPFRELLKRKVRRIHLGTHGQDVHDALHRMFDEDGWEIIFSYGPDSIHQTELGSFVTNDGILSVCNPSI